MRQEEIRKIKYGLLGEKGDSKVLYAQHDLASGKYSYSPQIREVLAGEYEGGDLIDFFRDKKIVAPEDEAYFKERLRGVRKGGSEADFYIKLKVRRGAYHVFRVLLKRFRDENGRTVSRLMVLIDANEEYNEIHKLQEGLKLDRLTGVYNEQTFVKSAREFLRGDGEERYVVVRMDIEHFRNINDMLGMDKGDEVLRFVGKTLRELAVREAEHPICYGRVRADVFALCIPYDKELIAKMVEFCSRKVNRKYPEYEIRLNFGLYVVEDTRESVEIMIDRANMAARTVKGNFLKKYAYYNEEMHAGILREQRIINDMESALQKEQFFIVIQPKCRIDTGEIVGAEALVRWDHPEEGMISPAAFIPVFEQTGLIYSLDCYVWERACMLLRRQLDEGGKVVPISVNVSRVDLMQLDLCDRLDELVHKYGIPAGLLELEITESANIEQFRPYLSRISSLRQRDFKILLDDFGSAYSTLNILCNMDINVMKIDIKSIAHLKDISTRENALLTSLSYLSSQMEIPAVIEGVETKEQVEFLHSIGFECVQGYYFYRPMPEEEYLELCRREG